MVFEAVQAVLDWSAEAWTALAAWATLGVAGMAAWFARGQVLEAQRTRREQAQPFVIVDFQPSEADYIFVELVIQNSGMTAATDVHFEFDPPLETTSLFRADAPLREAAIFRRGIPTMPPGRMYRILFDRGPDRFASDLPRSYDVTVTYSDPWRTRHQAEYRLDLDVFFGHRQVSIYTQHHAAGALREIRDEMKKWGSPVTPGLNVWSRDGDAADERERVEMEEWDRVAAVRESEETSESPDTPIGG